LSKIIKLDIEPFKETIEWDDYIGHNVIRAAKWRIEGIEGFLDIDKMKFHEKEAFDRNYKKVYYNMTFGMAIDFCLDGYYVARTAWDLSGEFLCIINPTDFSSIAGDKLGHGSYIAIKNKTNKLFPYSPAQSDMVASDWKILKERE